MNAHVKQADPVQVEVGDCTFYLYPFGAFKANNILGELSAVLVPLIGALAPFFGSDNGMDSDIANAGPAIAKAFGTLSGDKVEMLLKKLLTQHRNIAVDVGGEDSPAWMTEEMANELFCGNAQDMVILAFYVIKVNFSGFFEKLASPSGKVIGQFMKKMGMNDTGSSI